MTRINHTDVVFLNFFLRFSARDIPVLNAKKVLRFTFYGALNAFFEFSLCLVSVLNDNKCLEVIENCIQAKFLSFNTDTKHRENSKDNLSNIKSEFFAFSTGIFRAEKRRKKFKKTTSL